jgi:hypothetical protein
MTQNKTGRHPVRIFSDGPAFDNPVFGCAGYAETLAGLLAGKTNTTPFVLGIHGSRGAGKTTLMHAIKARLDADSHGNGPYRRCKTVWFQAWKQSHREDFPAALIETIFKAMNADGFFSLARAKIDTVARRFDKSSIFASISKLSSGGDISNFFSGPALHDALLRSETFQRFFDDLVWTFLSWRFKFTSQEKPDDRVGALVIFVDDLDRCRPGRIVETLETIKLFMDRSGCIFVLGACGETLHAALDSACGPREGRGLLEKIIQVGFTLPPIPSDAFARFLDASHVDAVQVRALSTCLPVIVPALGCNPRQFKRLVNGLNLLCGLLDDAGVHVEFDKVLSWWMITRLFGDLVAEVMAGPDRLAAFRESVQRLMDAYPDTPVWRLDPDQLAAQSVPESLYPCFQRKHLAETAMALDLTDRQFQCLSMLGDAVALPSVARSDALRQRA